MPDLFAIDGAETIDLPDADLRLWHAPDLGAPAGQVLDELLAEVDLRQHRVQLFGKLHPEPRLSAWYGEVGYRYSGSTRAARPWTRALGALKNRVEALTGLPFNSVLLNYYRDGDDRMGLHSDDEPELGERPAIASLSLGATRELVLRHRYRRDLPTCKLPLPAGSLLLMRGATQRYWRHGINRSARVREARLNLTFRYLYRDASIPASAGQTAYNPGSAR